MPSHKDMSYVPSLSFMVAQSIVYILAWTSLASYIHYRGPIPVVRTITKYNNWFYSFASIIQVLLITSPYLPHFLAYDSADGRLARTVYHWSKTYEYIDIFNVIGSGGEIELHFGFHHLTTPWLTWARVLGDDGGENGWRVLAALNAAHHVLMYAFFAGLRRVRNVIVVTGMVQLVAGIFAEGWVLGWGLVRPEERWRCWVCLGLLMCYFALFLRELWMKGFLRLVFEWLGLGTRKRMARFRHERQRNRN